VHLLVNVLLYQNARCNDKDYTFLLQYPTVAVAALTRRTLNSAAYNKHPKTNVSR